MVSGMEEDLKSISSQPPFVKTGPPFRFKCTNIAHHCTSLHHLYPSQNDSMPRQSWTHLDSTVSRSSRFVCCSRGTRTLKLRCGRQTMGPVGPWGPVTVVAVGFTEHRVCCFSHLFTSFHCSDLFRSVQVPSGVIWDRDEERNELLLNWQLQLCWTLCTTITAMNFALHATGSKQLTWRGTHCANALISCSHSLLKVL